MQCWNRVAQALQGRVDLQEAAWVGGGDGVGRCAQDMVSLAFPQLPGWLRLDQVVNARAAAADIGLRDIHHFQTRDTAQYLTRLYAHTLVMGKVAVVVVGDAHRDRMTRRDRR